MENYKLIKCPTCKLIQKINEKIVYEILNSVGDIFYECEYCKTSHKILIKDETISLTIIENDNKWSEKFLLWIAIISGIIFIVAKLINLFGIGIISDMNLGLASFGIFSSLISYFFVKVISEGRKKQEEFNTRKKIVEARKVFQAKKSTRMIYKEWNPDKWKDYSQIVYKIPARIWGSYDQIEERWNESIMKAEVNYDQETLSFDVEINKIKIIDDGKGLFLGAQGEISGKQIFIFYYDDDWYITHENIGPKDARALIDATTIRNLERIKKEIERSKNLVYGLKKESKRERIPDSIQTFIWNRDGGKCVKCGSNENLEFDHIIPVAKGGSNTARNIQLLCEKCNRTKGAKIGG